MFLLGILDFLFVSHAYHSILTRGASVQLVFGFEVRLAWEVGRTSLRWHRMGLEERNQPLLSTCSGARPVRATKEQPSVSVSSRLLHAHLISLMDCWGGGDHSSHWLGAHLYARPCAEHLTCIFSSAKPCRYEGTVNSVIRQAARAGEVWCCQK